MCLQAVAQSGTQQLERVEVTGSNIKRISKEGSSPVDVISAKEISTSGAKNVLELLRTLVPAIGNDGYLDTPNQNGFSRGVSTVSLRNLSATSTLILLNGRRMTPSAYANPNNGTSTLYDLNSIPVSALARVEVLKDGASAVYGSDAIGGVVNFITRNDYQGIEVKAVAGANGKNEYQKGSVSGTFGIGDLAVNGYNVMIGGDLSVKGRSMVGDNTDAGIMAADYRALNLRRGPYGSFSSASPFFTREGTSGARNFSQASAANIVNRVNCPTSQQLNVATADATKFGFSTAASAAGLLNRTFCNYDLDAFNEMQNPGTDASLLGRGTLAVSDSITAFGEFAYSRSERKYLAASRTISGLSPTSNFLLGGAGVAPSFQAILEVGHPDNPFPTSRAAVQMRFENVAGGNKLVNEGYRALAGVKGTAFGNWDWESAVLWNRSDRNETSYGFLRLPVLRQMLGPQSGGTNRSLASIAADPDLSRPLLNKGEAEILQWDAKVSTEFGKLPGGPIGMAAGVELRRESIEITPAADTAAGNILGLANTAVTGSRDVKSAFVEFRLPALKSLEVDLAGRVDKYPGIKTNFVPKAGFKWTATDILSFRGTYAEGFRAPAVSQVSPGGAQFFVNGLQDPIRCNTNADPQVPFPGAEAADCNKSVSGQGGANPALRPETAYSSSFGLVVSPTQGVDFVVGWFKIRKNGEVALGSAQDVVDHPERYPVGSLIRDTNPALLLNGQPGTGPLLTVATPWTNQGSTMVSGIDFEAKVSTKVMNGAVKWTNSLNGTYTTKYERIEQPGYPSNNLVGTRGGLWDWATSAGDIPRTKFRFSTAFETGAHNVVGAMNYVSGISLIRKQYGQPDGTMREYSGLTCHYGNVTNPADLVGANPLTSRSQVGQAPTATNGRDLYLNRFPGCAVSSWTTFDLSYSYTGFKNLTLAFNIQNVMDEKAPYDPGATYLGHNTGLHNALGRYFTVSASYKFK
ncbi:TonB-dependent receptor [Pelomonas sp. UHG3]|uniref:TonB-dependent receptor n=1 Tax=Roseateles hydrophilus TaxID=2975054 RepID=A0ACC6CCG3_9BURK|nr:TonB-dependent receptor [Pelomonas sp. UHG3]MCY4746024.1 TonB-dependent receptor [Pelomonas sp. UHG3]